MLSALVAAQTVTALEIKETGLTQSAPAAQIMLAQVNDGEIDEADRAMGNDNDDSFHNPESDENSVIDDSTALDEKIDELTTSQMAGLEAKEKFMTNKIKYLAQEKYDQFCAIEESCREKMAAQKAESRRVLDEALATAVADAKKCRTDFVEAQLVKKEIVKGKLEDLLNIAIQNIKELKVEGIFADSGLPQEDHATAIAAAIEAEIDTFTTDSNNLLTQGTEPMGFTNILATDLTAFKDTEASDAEGSCLDVIRATFEIVWQGDAMAMPQTDATRGEKNIYDAAVEQCIDKMND